MPQVNNVRLAFGYFGPAPGFVANQIENVKVDFSVLFAPEDTGKSYRVRIDLFEDRQDPAFPIRFFNRPFYTFTYRNFLWWDARDFYVIQATPGEVNQSVEHHASKDLNTNPRLVWDGDRLQDTPEYFYAVVTLTEVTPASAGKSAVTMHRLR